MNLLMSRSDIRIFDDEIEAQIQDPDQRGRFVFLDQHPEFPKHFIVESFSPVAMRRLEVGSWRAISVLGYDEFQSRVDEEGYEIVFLEDPAPLFDWAAGLNDDPGVDIISDFPGTHRGMLPFQIQGVNFMKGLRGGYLQHSTGCGKTVSSLALTRWYLDQGFDLVIHAVKAPNVVNVRRSVKQFLDLDAVLIDGTAKQRQKIYDSIQRGDVIVTGYEKFRADKDTWIDLVEGLRVLFIWDEAPTKLKNRNTALYRAVCEVMYTSSTKSGRTTIPYPSIDHTRPSELVSVALSATPIKKSPEDFFNVVRLLDPTIYGSVQNFNKTYVADRNRWGDPTAWRNLDLMALRAAHIVHQVDKEDPDIAHQFPEVMPPEDFMVALHPKDRRVYDHLVNECSKAMNHGPAMLKDTDLLAAINCLHMICATPRSVLRSADMRSGTELALDRLVSQWTEEGVPPDDITKRQTQYRRDNASGSLIAYNLVKEVGRRILEEPPGSNRSSKIQALLGILEDHEGKAVVFTKMNASLIPVLSEALSGAGVGHVVFHGELSLKAKQEAQDTFRSDPDCKVFLSSDSGSDSINLEAASLAIDFDEPYAYDTKVQRQNRIHRLTSTHASVRYLTIMVEDSVEERTREVWQKKRQHHEDLFKGEIAQQSMALRRDDLLYILTGNTP